MRIGIDARFLTHPQRGGFKTYTMNLVRALSKLDTPHTFVLYVDRPVPDDLLPTAGHLTYRVIHGTARLIGMPWREQILLPRRIADDRLDVVHFLCNTGPWRCSVPSVLTLHDVIQLEAPRAAGETDGGTTLGQQARTHYSRFAIRAALRHARHIITVSRHERSAIMQRCGVSQDRISAIYEAPGDAFRLLSEEDRASRLADLHRAFGVRPPFLLGVGYEPRKNIGLLIDAFRALADAHPTLQLVIVAADARRRAEFTARARALALTPRVVGVGGIPDDQLAALYASAELFVFPSQREAFGLPPLEAMACGAPIVASNQSVMPEILGDAAMLVGDETADRWAAALHALLNDDRRRRALAASGRRRAALFSWQRCAQETVGVYERVVAAGARPDGEAA